MLTTVTDKKLQHTTNNTSVDYYTAEVVSAQDYYPGGMQMPGRSFTAVGYRYGFNGKENDNEVKGAGNEQDYGMRIYDPRVGRFLSVDPLTSKYSGWSPYAFAMNSPISGVDLDGLEYYYAADGKFIGESKHNNDKSNPLKDQVYLGTVGNDEVTITRGALIHKSYSEFKKILGTIYNESSSSNQISDGKYDWKESAGIYDVMENRAPHFTDNVESSWFQKSGIYGLNKESSIAVRNYNYDNKNMNFKDDNGNPDRLDLNRLQIVTQGVLAGMLNKNSVLDYSGGGTTWHGNDFKIKGSGAYNNYYLIGFQFTNTTHDIWNLSSHENKQTLTGVVNKQKVELSYSYMYLSTGAAGGSTFMKRTLESFGSGYPAVKQALLEGNTQKAQNIVSNFKGTAAY